VRARFSAVLIALGALLTTRVLADDDWARAAKTLEVAKSWHAGDPLPLELRQFRRSPSDLPDPYDSYNLIQSLQNLELLAALALDLTADWECRQDAVTQGLNIGGPTRFFALLRPRLVAASSDERPGYAELFTRMSRPHVVVDALDISYADMAAPEALAVTTRITRDLKRGQAWNTVYTQYSKEFGYRTGNRTKIGNLGHFVLFPDPALGLGHYDTRLGGVVQYVGVPLPRRLWSLGFFDPSHLPTLLKATRGDVITLPSDLYHEYVLYQIQEIYKGDSAVSAGTPNPSRFDASAMAEVRTLAAFPTAFRTSLGQNWFDTAGTLNAPDIRSRPPPRRLLVGGLSENVIVVAYEQGGFFSSFAANAYGRVRNAWVQTQEWDLEWDPGDLTSLLQRISEANP